MKMSEIKKVQDRLDKALKVATKVKGKINERQWERKRLLDEVKALSPEYGMALADVNALERELSALMKTDRAAQIIAVTTATEKGRS